MANQSAHAYVRVEDRLLTEARTFSFVQAYRLLCKVARAQELDPATAISLAPTLSLELKTSEVDRIEKVGHGYTIYLNLPGLYGTQSPLANFYTEELVQAKQHELKGAQLLLDLLQRRLYQLQYLARDKHEVCQNPNNRNEFQKLLLTFCGFRDLERSSFDKLGDVLLQNLNTLRYLRGTTSGLERLLSTVFPDTKVEVREFQGRHVTIAAEERCLLGKQSHHLGENMSIGTKIRDMAGKVHINIKNIKEGVYQKLIADNEQWRLVVDLIRYCVEQPLLVDISFEMQSNQRSGLALDTERWQALGKNMWLYHSDNAESLPRVSATLKVM